MQDIQDFIHRCGQAGYHLSGSVFKIDYNGTTYNLGFWIRGQDWNSRTNSYRLPGIVMKVRHQDFNQAKQELLRQAEAILATI